MTTLLFTRQLIKGNTWGGTVFASYGCFWLGFGMLNRDSSVYPTAYPSESKTGWSLFYGLWALLTLSEWRTRYWELYRGSTGEVQRRNWLAAFSMGCTQLGPAD